MNCEMDGENNALWDYEHDPHKYHVWHCLEHLRKWLVDKEGQSWVPSMKWEK